VKRTKRKVFAGGFPKRPSGWARTNKVIGIDRPPLHRDGTTWVPGGKCQLGQGKIGAWGPRCGPLVNVLFEIEHCQISPFPSRRLPLHHPHQSHHSGSILRSPLLASPAAYKRHRPGKAQNADGAITLQKKLTSVGTKQK
jgi:hypothetical protein